MTSRERAIVTRHTSNLGSWELARATPAAALSPFVRHYVGWSEQVASPLLRRELPTATAPLIINFGAPYRLFRPGAFADAVTLTSFITGAYDTYQIVESAGATHGVQIDFTLLGMRLFVGRPIEDMTNLALSPEDVFGTFASELTGRLYDAQSWDERFAYLDRVLGARLREAVGVPAVVSFAWWRILESSGDLEIGALARAAGCSHRHFVATFKRELGLTPKVLARIVRFGRFADAARDGTITSVAEAALAFGYYDQSHLHRDATDFAGVTPGELSKARIPDDGGFGL